MRDESQPWQEIMATGFRSAKELLDFLEISDEVMSQAAEQIFVTRVPRGFAERMEKGNCLDPLLLQVLAQEEELQHPLGFTLDPLNEVKANAEPGLIHKYHGRVLLTVTGVCAVNCRYCFRRHFPYHLNNPGKQGWMNVIKYVAQDSSIHEIIFSGGDPLMASDNMLAFLVEEIAAIPHVKTLRIHTRIPVVLPERVTAELCHLLQNNRLNIVIVLHVNHPNELNETVKIACDLMRAHHFHLLNQSVLLARVNDDLDTLVRLSEQLFNFGVLPYYLHLLDRVQGSAHYEVEEGSAQILHRKLLHALPGYLVPRLVREVPEVLHKVQI